MAGRWGARRSPSARVADTWYVAYHRFAVPAGNGTQP